MLSQLMFEPILNLWLVQLSAVKSSIPNVGYSVVASLFELNDSVLLVYVSIHLASLLGRDWISKLNYKFEEADVQIMVLVFVSNRVLHRVIPVQFSKIPFLLQVLVVLHMCMECLICL